jgi:hypothetical protein
MDIAYRLDWITVLLALLALQGNPATLTAQLSVSSVSRIAAGPGARDRPSVVVGPNSFRTQICRAVSKVTMSKTLQM